MPVWLQAGLWGLLQTERMQILQHLFQPVVWSGNDQDEEANVSVEIEDAKGKVNADAKTTKEDQVCQPVFSPGTSNKPGADSNPMDDAQHHRVCCISLTNCHLFFPARKWGKNRKCFN